MTVYVIAKRKSRVNDLFSGSFEVGGRWNNPGTHLTYTSASRELAILELLGQVEASELPDNLLVLTMEIKDSAAIYCFEISALPENWRMPENSALKITGDRIFHDNKYLAIKAPSAIVPNEFNYMLNPLFPGFHELVKVTNIEEYNVDKRLL